MRLLLLLLCLPVFANATISFSGVLDSTNIATDNTGNFFYDYFLLENTTGSPITVSDISFDAGSGLQPWAAYWTSIVLPSANWDDDGLYSMPTDFLSTQIASSSIAGDTITLPSFTIPAGETYQLTITTLNYIGSSYPISSVFTYNVASSQSGLAFSEVPEPTTVGFLIGAAALLFVLRRRR